MVEKKRMSISLDKVTAKRLQELADLQGLTLNEALSKAITTEHFIKGKIAEGKIILTEDPRTQEFTQVVFW